MVCKWHACARQESNFLHPRNKAILKREKILKQTGRTEKELARLNCKEEATVKGFTMKRLTKMQCIQNKDAML
jgi:hypothetical protein